MLRRAVASRCAIVALSAVVLQTMAGAAEGNNLAESRSMKIRLTVGGKVATGTLNDSASARDFAALLPLTLPLEDYASTEKVA